MSGAVGMTGAAQLDELAALARRLPAGDVAALVAVARRLARHVPLGGDPDSGAGPSQVAAPTPTAPPSPEALKLTDFLRNEMLKAKPDHGIGKGAHAEAKWSGSAKRAAWARDADRMHRIDGRPWRRSAELVRWVFGPQRDGEAAFVVESVAALRKKWDRVDRAAKRGSSGGNVPGAEPSSARWYRERGYEVVQ